jgi:rubrerythrin
VRRAHDGTSPEARPRAARLVLARREEAIAVPFLRASVREIVQVLREALRLEREALDGYAAAISQLGEEPLTRDTAMSFVSAHERHVEELTRALRGFGRPPDAEDPESPRRLLPPERFAEAHGPTATLKLLKSSSDEVVRRQRALLARSLPEAVLETLRRVCNDELRHRAWLAARVQAFARTERRTSVPPAGERPSVAPR